MDLYSAARRLGCPFEFGPGSDPTRLPMGARGIIGDGLTCALVRVDGAIDWLCWPRFDSNAVFAQMLGKNGGLTAVRPSQDVFSSLQRYDPDTNVLETLFQIPGQGCARITDYMPWTDDPRASVHEVHRRVEVLEGTVDLDVIFDPRFDFGESETRIEIQEHGLLATSPAGASIAGVLGRDVQWRERPAGGVQAQIRLGAGQRSWFVLSWDAPRAEPLAAYRPFEQLRLTRTFWRSWTHNLRYDGPWRHHVMRSALLLKLLIYAPTGAMVAAPTTSLPEWIGGTRNWDYRFAWARDAALGIRAANIIGFGEEAREFFHFVRDVLDQRDEFDLMVAVDGDRVPQERTIAGLEGYLDSGPVRVGNGARDQRQLDIAGYVLDAALAYERCGGSLSLRVWRHLVDITERLRAAWHLPDHGIWEPRSGMQHNVHSKVMTWVALDRTLNLAPLFGANRLVPSWEQDRDKVRADVLRKGLDPKGNHFVSIYGGVDVDATLLLLPTYGFLPPEDPRAEATIDQVRAALSDNGFIYRYLIDDGIDGKEGAFVICGFWLAEALALVGRIDEAQEVFIRHAEASNHVGLLSEEIDPRDGSPLGNFPQAFSHIGLVNAAARIDLALRMRDDHARGAPRLFGEAW